MEKAKKKGLCLLLVLLVLAGIMLGTWRQQENGRSEKDALKVTLFKVGKADAIVVEKGNYTMVIDAGEEEDGEEIITYLENQGKDTVNDLVITHFDKDHVGGATHLWKACM